MCYALNHRSNSNKRTYSVSRKSSHPLKLFAVFLIRLSTSSIFASLYPHVFTKFGRFILLFNKMALIFLGLFIDFIVLSCQFWQVRLPRLHRQCWVAPIHLRPSLDYQVWGKMLESYHKLRQKPKQFPNLKLHFSWFVLPYQKISLTCERLPQATNGGHCEYMMW